MNEKRGSESHLGKNLLIIGISVVAAVLLAKSGVSEKILTSTKEIEIIGSFVAGFFFTSLFTTAPATVALGEIAQANSVILVALVGGVGAVLGDIVLFKFLKAHLGDELAFLISHAKSKRLRKIFHLKAARWLLGFLGALVIASPLPDELGLALMGITTIKLKHFIPISWAFNTIGILAIGLVARQIG